MAKKDNNIYVCSNCDAESTKWLGQCPQCSSWSTLVEVAMSDSAVGNYSSKVYNSPSSIKLKKIGDIEEVELKRISSEFSELDRVLGGGFVENSVVLISGEPGIGKSTLLLQVIKNVSASKKSVYISAEESIAQISLRGKRIFPSDKLDIDIASGSNVEDIIDLINKNNFKFAIIDSIQTLASGESRGLPGGFAQVKAVSSKLVSYAKASGVTLVIVGQITKQGSIAGPKLLEHLVDVVLQLEGDESQGYRMLRSLKNRYGSANEIGLFEMSDRGLVEIKDPMFNFGDDSNKIAAGVVTAAISEGNRTILIEIQALTVSTPYSLPKRVAEGITKSRMELITAIISKYSKLRLNDKDVYIKISGGLKIKDPGLDLPIALAIISSLKSKPVLKNVVAYGEISLSGKIKQNISRKGDREKEIKRLGYKSFYDAYRGVRTVAQLFSRK